MLRRAVRTSYTYEYISLDPRFLEGDSQHRYLHKYTALESLQLQSQRVVPSCIVSLALQGADYIPCCIYSAPEGRIWPWDRDVLSAWGICPRFSPLRIWGNPIRHQVDKMDVWGKLYLYIHIKSVPHWAPSRYCCIDSACLASDVLVYGDKQGTKKKIKK